MLSAWGGEWVHRVQLGRTDPFFFFFHSHNLGWWAPRSRACPELVTSGSDIYIFFHHKTLTSGLRTVGFMLCLSCSTSCCCSLPVQFWSWFLHVLSPCAILPLFCFVFFVAGCPISFHSPRAWCIQFKAASLRSDAVMRIEVFLMWMLMWICVHADSTWGLGFVFFIRVTPITSVAACTHLPNPAHPDLRLRASQRVSVFGSSVAYWALTGV